MPPIWRGSNVSFFGASYFSGIDLLALFEFSHIENSACLHSRGRREATRAVISSRENTNRASKSMQVK